MKIILWILFAFIFTLIATLRNSWFFDINWFYFFGVEELWLIDISFIKDWINKLLLIPDLIYKNLWHQIDIYASQYNISKNAENLWIIFLYYFILFYIIIVIISLFSFIRDKIYLSIFILIFYTTLLYFL